MRGFNLAQRTIILSLWISLSVAALTAWQLWSLQKLRDAAQSGQDLAIYEQRLTWSLVLLLLLAAATVLLIFWSAKKLNGRLLTLREGADSLASGDLSKTIPVMSDDEIGRLAASFNLLSERTRETYRRLALDKEQAETLLASMSEGIVSLDEHGHVTLSNPTALQLFGYASNEDVADKPVNATFALWRGKHKVASDTHPGTLALRHNKATSEVYEIRHDEGKPTLINIAANPVILEGKPAGAILVIRDVTKEREIDRMKTEFISLASHQLRTPLSAIKWFTEMLLHGDAGKLKSEQEEFAQNISDSAERMIELVNSLLNISRIESGRIIIDPKPTDLKELVTGIVNDLAAKTEERHQTLIISVHKDLPKINLDPRLIGQVYMNLLTNAIKYTPKGGEITVFVSRKGNEVVSQVTDNGYGIPVAQQGKLFQKFFRAENIIKVETDGTGLGLYLVKAIIESSGGKIWFKSGENEGTTFWFSLPLRGMKAKEGEVTLDN
jgi:PAS domain S-box-containing protein